MEKQKVSVKFIILTNISSIIFILAYSRVINEKIANFGLYIIVFSLCIVIILFTKKYSERMKFSLPKISRSQRKAGTIKLGKISSNPNRKSFFLPPQDLRKHIFINGLTGMGKSNFTQILLVQISKKYKKIPFLLTEFKGEYINLLNYIPDLKFIIPGKNYSLNIFDPRSEDTQIYAEKLMNLLTSCQIVTFSEEYSAQMEKILVEILENVCSDKNRQNWVGFDYYSSKIRKKYINSIGNINQTLISIENRLRRIKSGALKSIFDTNSETSIEELINSSTVLDLSGIINLGGTKNDAIFFANVIFNSIWLNNLKNGKCESIKHFTIIEDSQYFISQKFVNNQVNTNYIEDIALLLRGTGECLITINTRPNISEDIMANAGVIVSFQSSYDQEKMGKLLSLNESKMRYLTKLDVGECIIKVNSIPTPFALKIPKINKKNSKDIFTIDERIPLKEYLKNKSSYIQMKIKNLFNLKRNIKNKLQKITSDIKNIYIHNNSKKKNQNYDFLINEKEKNKDILKKVITVKQEQLKKNIETDKGFNMYDTLNNKKNYVPVSEWNDLLKSAENLFLIDQLNFSFLKCEDLYKNIINLFAKKWNISNSLNNSIKNIIVNLKNISPVLSNTIYEIECIRNNCYSSEIKENDVEKYLSLLKRTFFLIKIKKAIKNPVIVKNEGYEDNISNSSESFHTGNKMKSIPNSEKKIWEMLREAIIEFTERNI